MPTLLTRPPIAKGTQVTCTLIRAGLLTVQSVSTDAYFSNVANWKDITINYRGIGNNQVKTLRFDGRISTSSAVLRISLKAKAGFQVESIIIVDFDEGRRVIRREELSQVILGEVDIPTYIVNPNYLEAGTPDISFASGTENGTFYVDVMITKTGLDYDYNVTTFDIYRDQLGMGSFLIATIGPNQQVYRDSGAFAGASVIEYQVVAKIGNQVSLPRVLMWVADGGLSETLAIPNVFLTDHVSSLGLISVSWASSGADYDYSAMTFDVYRDDSLIATVPNSFTYEDSDVTSGVNYTYKVIGRTATETTPPGEASIFAE